MLNNVHGLLFTQSNIYNLRELTAAPLPVFHSLRRTVPDD